jgi:hypothetical protein
MSGQMDMGIVLVVRNTFLPKVTVMKIISSLTNTYHGEG